MRRVIAFCGPANSGKDYSAQRLMMTMGFKKVAYADALREVAYKALGLPTDTPVEEYERLKRTEIINGLTFRNVLENLGSAIRKYDEDFWAKTVINFIESCPDNVCISDLRYPNEHRVLKEYCKNNGILFKLVFCDYRSEFYQDDNPHESARMAQYLRGLGYKDQQYVDDYVIETYEEQMKIERKMN